MSARRVFLDSGGSAPLSPRVAEALKAGFADGWADPERLHAESRRARALLDAAGEAIGAVLGVSGAAVHFTPSPLLAIERAMLGMGAARRAYDRMLVSPIERSATLHAAEFARPGRVERLTTDNLGHVDLDGLRDAVAARDVALVAIQHANQEVGTVQRLDQIMEVTRTTQVPLLVDATASIGHVSPPEYWDALIANPADWGGPSGIGVLAMHASTRWLPAWPEGASWAPGGVSVPLALAAAVALQEREESRARTDVRLRGLVEKMRTAASEIEGVDVVGDPVERLPHVLTFSCLYVDGEALLSRLDRLGFAVGSGSACTSDSLEPSHVLAALGSLTHGNVRIALHPGIKDDDVDHFLAALPGAVAEVRAQLGAPKIG